MKFLLVLVFMLAGAVSFGQNMAQVLVDQFLPAVEPGYSQFTIEWNFSGTMQANMNSGLTELIDEKNFAKAAYDFSQVIAETDSYAPAYYYRGICYRLMEKFEEAEKDFLNASRLDPTKTHSLVELGKLNHLMNKTDVALKFFEKAIKLDKSCVDAYYGMGNLYTSLGQNAKAIKAFGQCTRIDPDFPKAFVRLGVLNYTPGKNTRESFDYFKQALDIDSTLNAALFCRGMINQSLKNYKEALKDWNRLVQFNQENPLLLIFRAFFHIELSDFDNSFNDFKKVLTSNYEDENKFRAGQTVVDRRLDLQYALSYIIRAGFGHDDTAFALIKGGFCLLAADRTQEAITTFKHSSSLQQSGLTYFLTALSFEHFSKHDSAFFYYNKALEYDNDIFDAHKKRGIYYSELKNWKAAFKDFQDMERIEPGLIITSRLRGQIRINFKDYYGGIIDFTKFLKADSSEAEAFFMRGICFKFVSDYNNAAIDFKRVLGMQPRRCDVAEELVDALMLLKDSTQALETIKSYESKYTPSDYLLLVKFRIQIARFYYDDALAFIERMKDNVMLTKQQRTEFAILEAIIEFQQQDYQKALKKLERILKNESSNHEALYWRSKTFVKLGDKTSAIDDLKIVAEANFQDAKLILEKLMASQ
jgi:tetratricopeptide (TPR) repeat protein